MELCDQYIHELIQLIPELNDFHKLPEYSHLRSNYTNTLTKGFQKKERTLIQRYYTLIKEKKQKSFYDLVFLDDLKIMIKESKYLSLDHVPIDSLNNFPLSYISAIQGETDYDFTDKQSYIDFLQRFKGIPDITTSIIQNMKQGIKYKDTLPRIIVLDLIQQYSLFLDTDIETIKFTPTVKQDIIISIKTYVIPSVKSIKSFLENEYVCKSNDKIGLYSLSGGLSIYKGLVEEQTMQGYTPKDVHDLGLREVKRIQTKLHTLKRKMKFKGTIEQFLKYTTTHFKDKQEIITYSKKLQKQIYDTIYPKYFEKTLVEKDLSDIKKVADNKSRLYAFYIGTKKRGTFYVNTSLYKSINKHELKTLTLHETIPGHHLQLMIHNRSENIPLYIQRSHNTGYIEGWGLYCENFTDLHTDKELAWKYVYELQRAVRLVIDTGIHAFKWSFNECFTYMKQYLFYDDKLITSEIIRYICIPSQALSYKIGELTILFLRDKYLKKYPNDLQGFHKLFFKIGPCSLDLLVKEFIKRNI
jgi:uncharacterized protein (DUF885 family)